jgi:hypothetical protein
LIRLSELQKKRQEMKSKQLTLKRALWRLGLSTSVLLALGSTSDAQSSVTVNAGTVLLVRMMDPVSSRDPQGKRFAATLETDLVANGTTVAKAGTKVYGKVQSAQQAGRFVGQSAVDLRLSEIAVGPNLVPLITGPYAQAGAKSVGKTARGAAAGAAIGAIAGDAGKGAAIGAVASGVKKGQAVTINPGTLLEFQLQQPVTVTVSP